jgi:hypothetical protein
VTGILPRGTCHPHISSVVKEQWCQKTLKRPVFQDELNREFYDPILKKSDLAKAQKAIRASVILFSGCQDNQCSIDGDFNGLFTGTMFRVWNQGKFLGTYRKFHKTIVQRMPPDQTPNYFPAGKVDTEFAAQKPFTI